MLQVLHDYVPTDPIEIRLHALARLENAPLLKGGKPITCDAVNRAMSLYNALKDAYPVVEVFQNGEGVDIGFTKRDGVSWDFAIARDGRITQLYHETGPDTE